ncbi:MULTISPECIES: hypothetical protein [unclassified Cryobacterium]|uniref:hypothetical protein n=1 Tax=unclassified Cryobacterium TaxID=2649013 RepID=UPI002AB51A1A|nr:MULTISPECIES: hypothetical protein [unclassified Cryobacterium]MDY7526476.1 hypothetical protein [Cryobacterium sp. 10C2]MDY7557719.1 hypothetical protein [Cryobacterium sp. 10C3]MEB0003898.1 hypothetical protein [Cryobacterium sp. RTC2.1]MEB0203213.1 hypothetical protein [Cryobacterium sp. 5I3]MEB0288184.1 hypothetical protein [Cryobacterium sp. 10S3]
MKLGTRSIVTLVAAVTMAAVLTACSPQAVRATPAPTPTSSGSATGASATGASISREAAAALLNAVPGLSDASIGEVISGLSTLAVIEVYVDDDSALAAPGVLDYVLRVGWATSFDSQPAELTLTVRNHGRTLDLQPQANLLAGVEYPAQTGVNSVYLDSPAYLGTWPGAVPTPPAA